MTGGILDRLAPGTVLGDGGYLLELEKRGYVQAGPFTPEVVLDHPEALEGLHREFIRAGADVIQTMTFYASEDKLATVGLSGQVEAINRQAVEVARKVAAEGDTLVAGNLCLTWAYHPGDPRSADRVRRLFDAQIETQLGRRRCRLLDRRDLLLPGRGAALRGAGEAHRAAGDGHHVVRHGPRRFLRGRRPGGVRPPAGRRRRRHRRHQLPQRPRAAVALGDRDAGRRRCAHRLQPAAFRTTPGQPDFTGRPEFPYALDPLQLSRQEMARFAEDAAAAGIGYIGSCCGTAAGHVRAMAKALGKRPVEERPWRSTSGPGDVRLRVARPRGDRDRMSRFRVGVVGLGGLGSAAAWWASRRLGDGVIGFERFELGHRRGASEDHSRIIRLSYHRPDAVRLAQDAYRAWAEVEAAAGIDLVVRTGGLDLYPAGATIDSADYLDAMDACGVGYEMLDAAEARRRWPMFRLDPDTTVVHQAEIGAGAGRGRPMPPTAPSPPPTGRPSSNGPG